MNLFPLVSWSFMTGDVTVRWLDADSGPVGGEVMVAVTVSQSSIKTTTVYRVRQEYLAPTRNWLGSEQNFHRLCDEVAIVDGTANTASESKCLIERYVLSGQEI